VSARAAGCPARVDAWVAEASRAVGAPIEAKACSGDRETLRLEPADAAPLDVEITRTSEHAFTSAGGFGLSPLLNVEDFKTVPAPRREPFERLVAWVDSHPDRVVFGGEEIPAALDAHVERLGVAHASGWLLLAAVALVAATRFRALAFDLADRLSASALFASALALRLALGAWGPLRINGLGPLWVMAAAVDPREAAAYGPGYAEVFSPLVRVLPLAPDYAVFASNAVISALLAVMVLVIARLAGLGRPRALLAAFLVALDPIAIRIATTESYVPVIATLVGAASAASAASAWYASKRDPLRAVCLALAAGLFASQAARVHPVAWVPVALAPLAATVVAGLTPRQRLGLGATALALCGSAVLLTSAPQILHAYETMQSGETMAGTWVWPHRDAWDVTVVAGGCLLLARPRGPIVLAALSLVALACTRHNYAQSALWQASYDRLYLAPLLLGACSLVPPRLAHARLFAPLATASLLALFAWRAPRLLAGRTTDHQEYYWARGELAALPPSCRVAYVAFADIRNLFLPTYVVSPPLAPSSIARLDGRAPIDAREAIGSLGCTYYVHSSLCSSRQGRPVCDDVERQLVLEPVARASFNALPSNDGLPYDRPVVESAVSRVVRYASAP
jgi:hypothetical protein